MTARSAGIKRRGAVIDRAYNEPAINDTALTCA